MSETDNQLRQLFIACDTDGSGFIGNDEVRDICAKFGIAAVDADSIFEDLDRDGDGKISFEDFQEGFDDYEKSILVSSAPLSPGFRRNADSLESIKKALEQEAQIRNTEKLRNKKAGELPEKTPLSSDGKKAHTGVQLQLIGDDIQNPAFLEELIENVNKLKQENQRLAHSWMKEKKDHEHHLYSLEQEMDSQVKEVELRVKQKAKAEIEAERKSLRDIMKDEMDELQAHLSMFEKVDSWLKANQTNHTDEKLNEFRTKLEEAVQENKQMRYSLMDTQTTIALMRSDVAAMRSQYEDKCKELASERERVMEALHDQEQLSRQLHILQDANRRLQDSNDIKIIGQSHTPESLQSDTGSVFLPTSKRMTFKKRGSVVGDYIDPQRPTYIPQQQLINETETGGSDRGSRGSRQSFCSAPAASAVNWTPINPGEEELDSGLSSNLRDDDAQDGYSFNSHLDPSFGSMALRPLAAHQRAFSSGCICKHDANSPALSTKSLDESAHGMTDNGPFITDALGPPQRTYKVMFIGDASVGKSSFIWRVTKGAFISQLASTLGVDFQIKTLSVDGNNVALQLWDTAGQERFRSITKSYFRKADGIMLLYDVSNEHSFVNVRQWMADVEDLTSRSIPVMIVGNKTDLRESATDDTHFFVSTEAGKKLAQDNGVEFLETSVKDGYHTLSAIGKLIVKMMENEDNMVKNSGLQLNTRRDSKLFSCCTK